MLDIRRRSGGKAEQAEQISIWRRRKGHGVPMTSAVRIVIVVGVVAVVVVVVGICLFFSPNNCACSLIGASDIRQIRFGHLPRECLLRSGKLKVNNLFMNMDNKIDFVLLNSVLPYIYMVGEIT